MSDSIIKKITEGEYRIVQDTRSGLWFQAYEVKALGGDRLQDMSNYRTILPEEINPYIWYSFITGEDVITNALMSSFKDKDNKPIKFGDITLYLKDSARVDEFYIPPDSFAYDFAGFTYPHSMTKEDVEFLLTQKNNVFSYQNFDAKYSSTSSYIWGISSSGNYALNYWYKLGIMDILKEEEYAKKDDAEMTEKDVQMIQKFLKNFLIAKWYNRDTFQGFLKQWKTEIDHMKKSLFNKTRDLTSFVPGAPSDIYSFNNFTKAVSAATSFVLNYGQMDVSAVREEYGSQAGFGDAFFFEDLGSHMEIKNYSGVEYDVLEEFEDGVATERYTTTNKTEEQIGSDYFTNSMNINKNFIWNAAENNGGVLFPTDFDDTSYEEYWGYAGFTAAGGMGYVGAALFGGPPGLILLGGAFGVGLILAAAEAGKYSIKNKFLDLTGDGTISNSNKAKKNISDASEAEDLAIIDFLKGNIGSTYGEAGNTFIFNSDQTVNILSVDAINSDPTIAISNTPKNTPAYNVLSYDVDDNTKNVGFDKVRTSRENFEGSILNFYSDMAFNLSLSIEDTAVDGKGNPVLDEDGNPVYNISKRFNTIAYLLGEVFARKIAADKINLLKATLFNNLEIILDKSADEQEEAIKKLLEETAKVNQDAGSLPYEEELTGEQIQERQKILEQCALLLNLKEVSEKYNKRNRYLREIDDGKNKSIHSKKALKRTGSYFGGRFLQFNNIISAKTMSQLYASKSVTEFLKLPPVLQALLIPKIKIQKMVFENSGIRSYDIHFNSTPMQKDNTTPLYHGGNHKNLFDSEGTVFRGGSVGIQSITFDFDGETPATAQKYVKSTMNLKFQDFTDLVKERNTTQYNPDGTIESGFYKYLDLIVNTAPLKDVAVNTKRDADAIFREHYNPVNYCIKIEVGWNYDDSMATKSLVELNLGEGTYERFKRAIEEQNKTFLMSALDHDLKINDNGTVDLQINYFSFTDALFESKTFNALTTASDEKLFGEELNALLKSVRDGKCSKGQLAKLQAAVEEKRTQRLKSSLQNLMARLVSNKLIRQVNLKDSTQLKIFKETGSFTQVPIIETDIDATKTYNPKPGITKQFIFLGDLLYTLMDCMYYDENLRILGAKNVVFALTDFEFTQYLPDKDGNPPANNPVNINMASIPIALDFFKEWFTDEIISSERTNYPLMQFIMVICNKLLGDLLSEVCFNKKHDKTLFFRQANIYGNISDFDAQVDFANRINPSHLNNRGVLNTSYLRNVMGAGKLPIYASPDLDASQVMNYIILFVDSKKEIHQGTGDPIKDIDEGTYHFYLGAKSGLVKSVSFSKTNIEYLRESRMMRFKGIADFAMLTNVYNVNMTMFGNFLLFPGMEIYLNPYSLGGTAFGNPSEPIASANEINFASLMGIGGYHLVKSVKTTIGVDKFETTVDAQFIFGGDVDGRDNGLDGIVTIVPQNTQTSVGSAVAAQSNNTAACQKIINTWETNNINEEE